MKTPLRRRLWTILLPAAAVAAAGSLVVALGLLAPVDRGVGDALLRIGAARPPPLPAGQPDVAVVAVDARSLRSYPAWPWPRSLYARAIERLDAAGARAIAFDIDFSSESEPAEDARLGQAIASSGRVVLATFRQSQQLPDGGELEVANIPIPLLAERAAGIGSVLVPADPDGVVRRAPIASEIAAQPVASLAVATLAAAQAERAPPSELRYFTLDYRRANPPFPVISISELIEGRFDASDVAGRLVFIGATAAEFQDLWTTPLGPAQPGVFIQAIAARTLAAISAEHATLHSLLPAQQYALIGLLSLALACLHGVRHWLRLLCLLATACALPAAALGCVVATGLVVNPVAPLAVIAAHYALGLEGVRQRFGRSLADRDSALAALTRVGEATTHAAQQAGETGDGLQAALSLLGEVVGASSVALLQTGEEGRLDGRRLEWQAVTTGELPGKIGDDELAARALATSQPHICEDAIPAARGHATRPGSAVYTPLSAGREPLGVLIVEREGAGGLDQTHLRTITTAGAQLALSAQNLRLIEELRETFSSSMAAMAAAIEARDGYTDLHCRRLSAFSCLVAERMGMRPDEIKAIELGALLHDVGKIGVPDAVLNKPGRFTPEERRQMERHPIIGAGIVGSVRGLDDTTLHCVRHHHERWNGEGYPDRLAGEAIPLPARIVSIVDVWDALSSHRPYKRPLAQQTVRELLWKGRGEQFDPDILDVFLRVLLEQGDEMLALIDRDAHEETA